MQRGGGGAGGASSAAAATAQAACAWHTAAQRVRPPSRACTAQCTACTAQRADPPAAHLQEGVFVQDAAAAGAQLAQPGLHVPPRLDGGRPRGRCHEALSPKGVGGCGGGGCWCCCRGRRGRGSSYGRRRGGGSHSKKTEPTHMPDTTHPDRISLWQLLESGYNVRVRVRPTPFRYEKCKS